MEARQLKDLNGVGKAALMDFRLLGITTICQLKQQQPEILYKKLESISGPQDICVLDVFTCAVAQAKNPNLPKAQTHWWYWSRKRKNES